MAKYYIASIIVNDGQIVDPCNNQRFRKESSATKYATGMAKIKYPIENWQVKVLFIQE